MAAKYNTQAAVEKLADKVDKHHDELMTKIDSILAKMGDHELEDAKQFAALDKRVSDVENTRRTFRWFAGTVVVGIIGVVLDFLSNHFTQFGGVK